jgi:hypothetical protein
LLNRLQIKSFRGKDATLSWKLEGSNDDQEFALIATLSVDFNMPEKNFETFPAAAGSDFLPPYR